MLEMQAQLTHHTGNAQAEIRSCNRSSYKGAIADRAEFALPGVYLLQGGDAFISEAAVDSNERVQIRQHRERLQTLVHDVLAGADVQVGQRVQLGDRLQRVCAHAGRKARRLDSGLRIRIANQLA